MDHEIGQIEFQRRYASSFSPHMSLVAIEPANLPHSFKQDCMQLVKKAKVALPFELTTCSHLHSLIFHSRIRQRPSSLMGTLFSSFCIPLFSEVRWELYHLDCKKAVDVLRRHQDVPKISGLFFLLCLYLFLVIEIDMPWKDNLEEKFGESFRPWVAIGNIIAALPHNRLTTIVSFIFLTLRF